MKDLILKKLSEKTTWLGVLSLVTVFGVSLTPELSESIVTAVLAIVGLVNVILNEKKS